VELRNLKDKMNYGGIRSFKNHIRQSEYTGDLIPEEMFVSAPQPYRRETSKKSKVSIKNSMTTS
jgi:hypothetical protein